MNRLRGNLTMLKFNWIQERINPVFLIQAVSSIFFGMLGAVLMQWVIGHYYSSRIATVNVTVLQDSFIKETTKQNISKEEMASRVALFSQQLNQAINQVSKDKQATLLISEAVIGGGQDYTQMVAEAVKRGMNK